VPETERYLHQTSDLSQAKLSRGASNARQHTLPISTPCHRRPLFLFFPLPSSAAIKFALSPANKILTEKYIWKRSPPIRARHCHRRPPTSDPAPANASTSTLSTPRPSETSTSPKKTSTPKHSSRSTLTPRARLGCSLNAIWPPVGPLSSSW
jgi:hypothetical protein